MRNLIQETWCPGRMRHRCTLLLTATLAVYVGCARHEFRQAADREAYCLIDSRESSPLWELPNRRVEPAHHSRMYLAAERDCGPKPIDDAAAKRYMDFPKCFDNRNYYGKIATRSNTENPVWLDYLPRGEQGELELTQSLAMDLALLHSRDYQNQFENVYLTALDLSGNRFEFDTQWFGGVGGGFTATGSDLGDNRLLGLTDRLGFQRNLAGGGQFATQVLNGLSWDFGSGGIQAGSAALVSTFTQPLLRGAFRHVRLEDLTQAERNLLYSVRDFARFRRQFYVNLMEDYLSLLTQAQAIRNTETNVENLRQNLVEHEYYSALEIVSQVEVDQVFQQYQDGRRLLLAAEQNFLASQDQFKFQLGLPAWLNLEIDESLLEPFELTNPELDALRSDAQELYLKVVQHLPPNEAPVEMLRETYADFVALRAQVAEALPEIEAELDKWLARLDSIDVSTLSENDALDLEQQVKLAERVQVSLDEMRERFTESDAYNDSVRKKIDEYENNPPVKDASTENQTIASLLEEDEKLEAQQIRDYLSRSDDNTAIAAWNAVEEAIGRQLREEIGELYVAQTQIRIFLIDIQPREIRSEQAITYAFHNRLDLKNNQATVMDAFRRVEVAADALESDLSLTAGVALGSDAGSNTPFKFDSANNQYNVGVQFDGPLNRLNERNTYRATQILYQRASRGYIAQRDQIANEVRSILRQLELSRLNFQIARQQVVAATRQVDQAQIQLRQSSEGANLTLILLRALEGVLDSKNNLIANWVQYRVQKMRLYVALEMLYLDGQGVWLNEDTGLDELAEFEAIDPEYFPPQVFANQGVGPKSLDEVNQPEMLPVPEPVSAGDVLNTKSRANSASFKENGEEITPAEALNLNGEPRN